VPAWTTLPRAPGDFRARRKIAARAVPGRPFWAVMLRLRLTSAARYAWGTPFSVLAGFGLKGPAAAAAIGMIHMVGNLAGLVGPTVVGYLFTGRFTFAQVVPVLPLRAVRAAALILAVPLPPGVRSEASEQPGRW